MDWKVNIYFNRKNFTVIINLLGTKKDKLKKNFFFFVNVYMQSLEKIRDESVNRTRPLQNLSEKEIILY